MRKRMFLVLGALLVLVLGAFLVRGQLDAEQTEQEPMQDAQQSEETQDPSTEACGPDNCAGRCAGTCGVPTCGCT